MGRRRRRPIVFLMRMRVPEHRAPTLAQVH